MRNRHVLALCMVAGASVGLLPLAAVAQVPFSSTQSPGMNPFNRNNNLPANTPPPRQQQATYPGGLAPYGSANGMVPTASAVTGPIDPDHRLGPGDTLSYSVVEDRDDKVSQLFVTASGEVELPLGSLRVKASGKTTAQLAADVKSVLEREYYKPGHATVRLGLLNVTPNASKGRVFVTGEVNGKGAIDLPADGQLTVVQAILQLGGFTPDADLKKVFIVRNGAPKKGIQVNAKAVLNGENDKDVVLQPGDKVRVDRKFIGVQF